MQQKLGIILPIIKILGGVVLGKTPSKSRTEQVQILSQSSLNGYKRLFGGKLMEWIDVVAAVAARRHSGKNVTTAAVESLEFKCPAYANDTLVLEATVVYTGRTSMDVCVKTYTESLGGERKMINKAYVTMVALDDNEKPTAVEELIITTEEERTEWEKAEQRRAMRKKLKQISE